MGWKRKDKRERNQRLFDYAKEHPDATHKTLGGIFHLSPSRVTRILQKASQELSPTILQAHQDDKQGGFLSHLIAFFRGAAG